MLSPSTANLLLVSVALTCAACGATSTDATPITLSIDSQDNIVSEENGTLELTEGLLAIRRATSKLTMSGESNFPEGPQTITRDSEVELHLLLRGMFFYLAPISDAVDGRYEAGETDRDFLTMDLIGMFDLRVLP